MEFVQALILALIQGITEFLPVSSSAHLILPAQLLGWEDQGLAFDVAVHLGTLVAVVAYYRLDLQAMIIAWLREQQARFNAGVDIDPDQAVLARQAWMVAAATLPAVLVAALGGDFIEANFRSVTVIALATIGFGLLLGAAERVGKRNPQGRTLSWRIAMLVGLAQVCALIPGASRSGVTITAGVLLGLSRQQAARFSFLLSIPIILAASVYALGKLLAEPVGVDWGLLAVAVLASALSAYLCIAAFLRLLDRVGFMPFVWYRLVLGAVLLLFFV